MRTFSAAKHQRSLHRTSQHKNDANKVSRRGVVQMSTDVSKLRRRSVMRIMMRPLRRPYGNPSVTQRVGATRAKRRSYAKRKLSSSTRAKRAKRRLRSVMRNGVSKLRRRSVMRIASGVMMQRLRRPHGKPSAMRRVSVMRTKRRNYAKCTEEKRPLPANANANANTDSVKQMPPDPRPVMGMER